MDIITGGRNLSVVLIHWPRVVLILFGKTVMVPLFIGQAGRVVH